MDNGINSKNIITISVYPSEEGFGCTLVEPTKIPLTADYSVALTIAHGMVKLALDNPDLIFDAGMDSLSNPKEDLVADLVDLLEERKKRLH